jgi:exopolysaccharide production protein ExoZ
MSKLYSIQYLRAIAALAVVLFHAAPNEAWFGALKIGAVGVDIFFVISGFIIWIVTSQQRVSVEDFVWNRTARIVPLYWSATLLLAALIFLSPASFPRQLLTWPHLVMSLLFVPHASPVDGSIMPVVAQGWTLLYEVFFYALFAVSLLVPRTLRMTAVVATLIVLSILGFALHPDNWPAKIYTSNLLLEFALGLLIARLWERGLAHHVGLGCGAIVAGLCGFALSKMAGFSQPEVIAAGIPAALLVYGGLSIESVLPKWRLAEQLGTSSYSIYIWHGFVIALITKLGLPSHLPGILFVIVGLALSALAGLISYAVIEAPSLRWLRTRRSIARQVRHPRYAAASELP